MQDEQSRCRQRHLAVAQRLAGLGSWEEDPRTGRVSWSAELFRVLGLAPDAVTPGRRALLDRVHPQDVRRLADGLDALTPETGPLTVRVRLRPADSGPAHSGPAHSHPAGGLGLGSRRTGDPGLEGRQVGDLDTEDGRGGVRMVEVRSEAVVDRDGRLLRRIGTVQDVTELIGEHHRLRNALAQAAQARAILDTALDATSDGFAVFDLDGTPTTEEVALRVVHVNGTATRILGVAAGDVIGADGSTGVTPGDALPPQVWTRVRQAALQRGWSQPRAERVHLAHPGGTWAASYDLTVATVRPGRVVLTWRDATGNERARRTLERAVRPAQYAATHDALTGLPNGVLLRQRLTDLLSGCGAGEWVAVAVCDLQDLQEVNCRHGDDAGDAVLQATADRIRGILGPRDSAARLGGGEFALLLPRPAGAGGAQAWLAQVNDRLSQPVAVRGTVLAPSVSLGLAFAVPGCCGTATRSRTELEHEADTLLAMAQQALHRSRSTGRPVLAEESPAEAEQARLAALQAYDVHNSRLDQLLRAFTQVAAGACDTELAMITFIDAGVQWVRASNTLDLGGLDELCGPRHLALCDHTVQSRRLLVIPDLHQDPRYRPSPHASWQLGARFYAGAPLITPEGRAIGSLCVLDSAPTTLSRRQRRSLEFLADEVVALLDAYRAHPRAPR